MNSRWWIALVCSVLLLIVFSCFFYTVPPLDNPNDPLSDSYTGDEDPDISPSDGSILYDTTPTLSWAGSFLKGEGPWKIL
jgi:hypothetical protein